MISLNNDPAPLLRLTDVTCGPCHVCVLECDHSDIGIAESYCFVLHFFLHPIANLFFQHAYY